MQQREHFTFSIQSMVPPPTDMTTILQRADEVNTVQRMLSEPQTCTVILTGTSGAGKSTLAALLYRRSQLAAKVGLPAPRHFVWLSLGLYSSLPDVIAAILSRVNMDSTGFYLLKPQQQIARLVQALRRPQEPALVVLDQFEELFDPETSQLSVGRGAISLFLESLLQMDLGASRLLLTCYQSPYSSPKMEESRVRSYLISRMSIPEGVALLQLRGVQGSPEELSLAWQRCGGHAFALVLLSTLVSLSGLVLTLLLHSPDFQSLWSGEVTLPLISTVCRYLNPIQSTLMRILSLFSEPVSLQAIIATLMEEGRSSDSPAYERELATLTQLALVRHLVDEQGHYRYVLHPLLRQYILEHYFDGSDQRRTGNLSGALGVSGPLNLMANNPEAQRVALAAGHTRVAAYYQNQAQQYCPPRGQRTGLRDVAPLLIAVRHLCLGWHWQQACDLLLAEGLHESLEQWGAWNTLISLYTAMLPPFGVLTQGDEALVSSHLSSLYARSGDYQQSREYCEQALAIYRELGDSHGEAVTLANQGELLRNTGELQQARACFEQALLLNRQQSDPLLESALLHNLGLLYHTQKDYLQALSYYQESLKQAHGLKEYYNEGMILTNMGLLLYEQGHQQEAVALLLAALRLRQSVGDSTSNTVDLFLAAIKQKMEPEPFARMYQAAQEMQEQLISRLMAPNVRQ
jgi:tetratricopeptide (TPR) repeat protein